MSDAVARPATAFDGERRLASGPLIDVAMAVKAALAAGAEGPLLAFDDATGAVIDLDLRGARADVAARLAAAAGEPPAPPRGRGRPKSRRRRSRSDAHAAALGMARRAARRRVGGAAPSGRSGPALQRRPGPHARAQEAAYRFMSAMAGDLPGFEEATRALFAKDRTRFEQLVAQWPGDVGAYAAKLAAPALA